MMPTRLFLPQEDLDAVLAGHKRSSLRWNEQVQLGPVDLLFPAGQVVAANVTGVTLLRLEDVLLDLDHTFAAEALDLRQALQNAYAGLGWDSVVSIVGFELRYTGDPWA
jgi:hypothetical protein